MSAFDGSLMSSFLARWTFLHFKSTFCDLVKIDNKTHWNMNDCISFNWFCDTKSRSKPHKQKTELINSSSINKLRLFSPKPPSRWIILHVHNLEDKSSCECLIYILCYEAFSWLLIPMTLMDGAKWFISSLALNLCSVLARNVILWWLIWLPM